MAGELPQRLVHTVHTDKEETAMVIVEKFLSEGKMTAVYPPESQHGDDWVIQVLEWD